MDLSRAKSIASMNCKTDGREYANQVWLPWHRAFGFHGDGVS